ncbi:ferredoxin [Spirochaetia bacterium 38H-sp]|uniref:Ferredoxin n=1 Tax=Rarispira pelagica TaxID=3141764 RepID=A0ABU9U9F9_9SPIR
MLIDIDKEKCILCGICEETLPDIFEIKNNITIIKKPVITEETKTILIRQLEEDCPAGALKIKENKDNYKDKVISFYVVKEKQ